MVWVTENAASRRLRVASRAPAVAASAAPRSPSPVLPVPLAVGGDNNREEDEAAMAHETLIARCWYFLYSGSQVFFFPYLSLYLQGLGFDPARVGYDALWVQRASRALAQPLPMQAEWLRA
jgi:hypothetical protein